MGRLAQLLHATRRATALTEEAEGHAQDARRCRIRAERTSLRAESVVQSHEAASCALRAERTALAALDCMSAELRAVETEAERLALRAGMAVVEVARLLAGHADTDAAKARDASLTFDARAAARKAQQAAPAPAVAS